MGWLQKAGIGAVGGIALSLLKLIDNGFFIESGLNRATVAAYLTYAAYVLLGMIVAVFLTDPDTPLPKLGRSAFVLGLLAPSVLLAITTKQVSFESRGASGIAPLPKLLGTLFISAAQAQSREKPASAQPTGPGAAAVCPTGGLNFETWSAGWKTQATPNLVYVQKADVNPKFSDGVWTALGRPQPSKKYIFVLGEAPDLKTACSHANLVNGFLKEKVEKGVTPNWEKPETYATVLKPTGTSKYIVTIGGASDFDTARFWKTYAKDLAVGSIVEAKTPEERQTVEGLLRGEVIQGGDLFKLQ